VAQIADFLATAEGMSWVLTTGVHRGNVIVSLRSSDRSARAGMMLRTLLGEKGRAGGHGLIAGGQAPLEPEEDASALCDGLARGFLRMLGHGRRAQMKPLVSRLDLSAGGG